MSYRIVLQVQRFSPPLPSHPQYFDRSDLRLFDPPKESQIRSNDPFQPLVRHVEAADSRSNLCNAPADCSVKAQYSCIYPWGSRIGVKGFLPRSRPGKAVSVARSVRAPGSSRWDLLTAGCPLQALPCFARWRFVFMLYFLSVLRSGSVRGSNTLRVRGTVRENSCGVTSPDNQRCSLL